MKRCCYTFYFILIIVFLISTKFSIGQNINDKVITIENNETKLLKRQKIKKLNLIPVFKIGKLEGDNRYILGKVIDVAIDKNRNFYICDYIDKCIKIYNQEGYFVKQIGRTGQGPGEFLANIKVAISSQNNLIVLDFIKNARVTVFNHNGDYINAFKWPGYLQPLYIFTNQREEIILVNNRGIVDLKNKFSLITHYDYSGKLLSSYGEILEFIEAKIDKQFKSYRMNIADMSFNGNIYCAVNYPYLIRIYSKEKLIKIIKRKCENFEKPELIKFPGIDIKMPVLRSKILSLKCLPDGRFVVIWQDKGSKYIEETKAIRFMESYKGHINYYLDLFNQDGEYLRSYKYEKEKYGDIIHVDSEGHFYTNINEEIPMLVINKVIFE